MSSTLDCQPLPNPASNRKLSRSSLPRRLFVRILRLPLQAWHAVRRWPIRTSLLFLVLLASLGAGIRGYALREWRAAQAALKEERFNDARDRLGLCLRVWPRNAEVHLLAARTARLTGDFSAAEAHLNRCLELNRGATEAVQLEFLLMRFQSGDMDELASPLFDLVEKGHPDSQAILDTIARAYMNRLRYKPAYACLSRWIELHPSNARPYHWRGWVLERLNNPKAAKKDYEHALELDPESLPARLRVAEMLLEDKQAPDALPHLERLYQKSPNDPRIQARLGMCRFLLGDAPEARRLMEAALVELPDDAPLLISLASLDIPEGHVANAERRLRRVLEMDRADTEALFLLASVFRLQNRMNEAAATQTEYDRKNAMVIRINALLKDVVDSPAATADNYAELGSMCLEIGRDKVALYWLNQALERDPANQNAHSALASHYAAKGDQAKADAHRRQLRPPTPDATKPKPVP